MCRYFCSVPQTLAGQKGNLCVCVGEATLKAQKPVNQEKAPSRGAVEAGSPRAGADSLMAPPQLYFGFFWRGGGIIFVAFPPPGSGEYFFEGGGGGKKEPLPPRGGGCQAATGVHWTPPPPQDLRGACEDVNLSPGGGVTFCPLPRQHPGVRQPPPSLHPIPVWARLSHPPACA